MAIGKEHSQVRGGPGRVVRLLLAIALTGLLLVWTEHSNFARVFIGFVVYLPTCCLKEGTNYRFDHEVSFRICFLLEYGTILGLMVVQPFKRKKLNFVLPIVFFVVTFACSAIFMAYSLYSLGASDTGPHH